ncbi:MAG TPA: HNH endonuclease [Burkholderiales bacterium]|nr:HNH endonuclease [Burkholderiales bacterium]
MSRHASPASGFDTLRLEGALRASHAKPWAVCTSDEERLDVFNGFLLVAQLDALFDRRLITFDSGGRLVITSHLAADHRALMHLHEELRLRWIAQEHLPFLLWHREHVFRG